MTFINLNCASLFGFIDMRCYISTNPIVVIISQYKIYQTIMLNTADDTMMYINYFPIKIVIERIILI